MIFQTGTPESVGISSRTISAFLDQVEEAGIELHGLSVWRRGKLCASGSFYPYDKDTQHLLYSATKSVVAVAFGFAEQEGKVSYSERISDIFAELMGDYDYSANPNLKEATVEHLLTMSCGHHREIYPYQEQWIRAFLKQETPSRPGEHFLYNTPGVNLLCAILKRKTGEGLAEYLRPRLFDPLGMGPVRCDKLADGTDIGGGGLFWSLEDFCRFALFLLNRGSWEGRQLLAEEWFGRACVPQITASMPGGDPCGYGYLIWMGRRKGAFQCNGMLGQYAIILPEQEAFVVTMANCTLFPEASDYQNRLADLVYDILVEGMQEDAFPEDPEEQILLSRRLKKLALPALSYSWSDMEKKLAGKVYRTETPVSAAAFLGYQFLNESPLHRISVEEISFRPEEDVLWLLAGRDGRIRIPLGKKSAFVRQELCGETAAGCARWRSRRCLELEIRLLEGILGVRYLFRFSKEGDAFTVEADPIQAFGFSAGAVDADRWSFRLSE